MKPTIEEVEEYFKDAEKISWEDVDNYEINTKKFGIYFDEIDGSYRQKEDDRLKHIQLWNPEEGYAKILTYKKPSFRPIAMKCNQEQFDVVKWKLMDYRTDYINNFNEYPYLTNYLQHGNQIATCTDFFAKNNTERHDLHETWNEKVFLEACGIVVEELKEEGFVITKEQIKVIYDELDDESKYLVEDWFPSVFVEDKKELVLEVGKWYKSGDTIFNHQESGNSYGILRGKWEQNNWITRKEYFSCPVLEMTPEEVKEALTKEAVKRYKVGDYLKNHQGEWSLKTLDIVYSEKYNNGIYNRQESGKWLFLNGKWAEICETITKEEAEKLLNKKII